MQARWTPLLVALLLPTLGGAAAQTAGQEPGGQSTAGQSTAGLTIVAPPERSAAPGSYVTLMFQVTGQGEYEFVADGGADWVPVTRSRRVKVGGSVFVPVSFKVPPLAPVGVSPPLQLKAMQGGGVAGQASVRVNVEARARVALSSPAQVDGRSGERLIFPVEVSNLGNQTDTIELKITNVDSRPQLSERSVILPPGGRKTVQVSLLLENVSPGYEFTTYLEAVSGNNSTARGRTRTTSLYDQVRRYGDSRDVRGPQLTFSVGTLLEGGYVWKPGGSGAYWRYQLLPGVSGQLSDFARGDLGVTGLAGSQDRWQPDRPSVGFSLKAPRWDVSGALGLDLVEVRSDLQRGAWTFSPRVAWRRFGPGRYVGLGVQASGPWAGGRVDGDLSTSWLTARSGQEGGQPGSGEAGRGAAMTLRQDALGVVYGRSVRQGLGFSVGASVYGQQTPEGYRGGLLASQQLYYTTPKLDMTQVYTVQWPGIHTLGLTAGTRQAAPFGVRAGVTLQRLPDSFTYGLSGLLSYQTPRGLGGSVAGRYRRSSDPQDPADWQVEVAASLPTVKVGPSLWTFGARYTVQGLVGHPVTQEVAANTEFLAGRLQGNAQLLWQRQPLDPRNDTPENADWQQKLAFQLQGNYTLNTANRLAFTYHYNRLRTESAESAGLTQLHALGLGWERQWNKRLSTQLSVGRSWQLTAEGLQTSDYLTAGFGVQDVFIPGLKVGAAYTLSAPQGLGQGQPHSSVRLTLGYTLNRNVDTPGAVVKLFGGRRGGEVTGVLYQDSNLNGVKDSGEAPLAGVTVVAGSARSVTSPEGRYRLQLPLGTYTLAFKGGVPATLEALQSTDVQVKENASTTLNVPFAPVGMLQVQVFDDRNRNAVRDPDEPPIPYAGVLLGGPVKRTAKADASGMVRASALPFGKYSLTLTQLPENYTVTTPEIVAEVRAGQTTPTLSLAAALPEKKNVSTYQEGNVAILARLEQDRLAAGQKTRVQLRVMNAVNVTLEAFGQTASAPVKDNAAALEVLVPTGTAPGQYDLRLSATGTQGQKTIVLKVQVVP